MNFELFLSALEARHLADLQFAEVTRALRALSSRYVERRDRLRERGAFETAGKRAAYALYYSPLHFMTIERIADALEPPEQPISSILDLGCGCGAAGAAFALRRSASTVIGIDTHPWALTEAAWTYRYFSLESDIRRGHTARVRFPRSVQAIVVGWMLNELDAAARAAVGSRLLERARSGVELLVVEPIATRVAPWWTEWCSPFSAVGARVDEWRFQVRLPELLYRLDRAAGLRHDELTARSLYVSGSPRY